MKYKKHFLAKISNSSIFFFIVMLVYLKVIFYVLVKNEIILSDFVGASDADYYHGYVLGYFSSEVNIWPVLLKYLDNYNLYSREVVSYVLFLVDIVLIPFITCKVAGLNFKLNQKYYLYLWLLCSLYPTIYFFTFDVYRDVFMVLCFLIGCLVVKASLNTTSSLNFIFLFIVSLFIGWFLAELRPYLGVAFIGALFLWNIKFTKRRIFALSVLYLLVLFIANYIGVFNDITDYRGGFEEIGAGSTLGLSFSNPILFIPNFILSFLGQMLGLYITNPSAVILLLVETIPFFFMLLYVIKNIKLADNFVRFLIIFFVLYASVWLIGNDNLGTAVRLRMYNYLAIYISFFYILRLKSQSLKNYRL